MISRKINFMFCQFCSHNLALHFKGEESCTIVSLCIGVEVLFTSRNVIWLSFCCRDNLCWQNLWFHWGNSKADSETISTDLKLDSWLQSERWEKEILIAWWCKLRSDTHKSQCTLKLKLFNCHLTSRSYNFPLNLSQFYLRKRRTESEENLHNWISSNQKILLSILKLSWTENRRRKIYFK